MKRSTSASCAGKAVTVLVGACLFVLIGNLQAAPTSAARAAAATASARPAAAAMAPARPSTAFAAAAAPARSVTTPDVRAQFNRQTVGATSGVKPKLMGRAYAVLDKQRAAGGAPIGLRSHVFKNDGRNGTVVLPRTTNSGQAITYQTTYLRSHTPGRKYANARVTLGSDGRAYLSRHHGNNGGTVKRIQ
jgi:hypothetical protein